MNQQAYQHSGVDDQRAELKRRECQKEGGERTLSDFCHHARNRADAKQQKQSKRRDRRDHPERHIAVLGQKAGIENSAERGKQHEDGNNVNHDASDFFSCGNCFIAHKRYLRIKYGIEINTLRMCKNPLFSCYHFHSVQSRDFCRHDVFFSVLTVFPAATPPSARAQRHIRRYFHCSTGTQPHNNT